MSDSVRGLAQYNVGIPGVGAAGAPRDQMNINAPANAFGAINARTQQQFGSDASQGSGQLEQAAETVQNRQNQTATDEAFNHYNDQTMNLLYGDPNAAVGTPERGGLISLRGSDALNAGPGIMKQLSDLRSSIKGGLQNQAQQLKFDEDSRRLLTATTEQVGRHLDAQQQAWQDTVAKSTLDTQMRSASLNYNDDTHMMHTLADANAGGIKAFRSQHGGDGTDPAALQAGQDQQGMIVHAAIEGAASQGDWATASHLFDKFGSALAPNVAASIGQELHAKARKAGNDAYLDNLLGGQVGDSGLNGAPRPNTAHHMSGDLVVADQPSGQTIQPEMLGRAQQIIDGLKSRGIDPVTATAFAANAIHESEANPGERPGDMGNAHGLMMWTDKDVGGAPGRAQKFRAENQGQSPENTPLDKQLDFIVQELHGDESGAWTAIQSAHGLAAKTAAVSKYYERPKDINGEQARRGATALQLASQTGLDVGQGGSSGTPATTTPADGSQGAQPSPAPAGATVQQAGATGAQPQAYSIPTALAATAPAKAPADQYPDESALTLQVLRDTRGDPDQREALLSGLRQRMSIIHMATETDRVNLTKSLPNVEAALSDGKDGVQIPEAQIRHLLPPAQAAQVMEELNTAQSAGQAFKSVAWGSPDDIIAARQRLTAGMGPASTQVKKGGLGVAGEEEPGEDTGTEAYRLRQKVLAKFDEKVAARQAALKDDPAAFAGTAPPVVAAAKALNENDPQSIANYFNAISAVQTHLGIPEGAQHLMSVQQATSKAAQLSNADPSQVDVGKMIDKMGQTYGDNWNKVFGDLVNIGKLNPQYQTLAMIGDPTTRNDFQRMLSSAQSHGGTSKLKDAAGEQARQDVNQNIESYLTDFKKTANVPGIVGNVDMVDRMRTSITDLALFYTLQGQDGATAVKNASAGILGRYDFDGTKRIPKGTGALVDAATANAVANLKPEDIAPPPEAYDTRHAQPATPESREASTAGQAESLKQSQSDMLALVNKKAVWVNNESDNGLVLFTQMKDGRMFSVRRTDGSRVEVPFNNLKKLATPPSDPGTVGGVAPGDATILNANF